MIKIKDGSNVKVYRNLPEQVAKNQRDIEDLANQTDTEVEALKGRVTTAEENIQNNADDIAAIKDGTNIDSFKDVEEALDLKADKSTTYTKTEVGQFLDLKLNTQTIRLTGTSGTLTDEEEEIIENNLNIIIRGLDTYYYRASVKTENNNTVLFIAARVNYQHVNNTYYKLSQEYIFINTNTKEWQYTEGQIINVYNNTDVDNLLNAKQPTLVSGTNIKTVNSTSLLGSGDISVQPTLVSGTNIKTINNESILGSGNITIQGGGSVYTHNIKISDISTGNTYIFEYISSSNTPITTIENFFNNVFNTPIYTEKVKSCIIMANDNELLFDPTYLYGCISYYRDEVFSVENWITLYYYGLDTTGQLPANPVQYKSISMQIASLSVLEDIVL